MRTSMVSSWSDGLALNARQANASILCLLDETKIMQDDKSFKQAMEELNTRIAKEIQDAILARIERLIGGATVAEVTADIDDERMRRTVSDFLLYLRVDALIASLEPLGVLNHRQVEEIHTYLRDRLSLPR